MSKERKFLSNSSVEKRFHVMALINELRGINKSVERLIDAQECRKKPINICVKGTEDGKLELKGDEIKVNDVYLDAIVRAYNRLVKNAKENGGKLSLSLIHI